MMASWSVDNLAAFQKQLDTIADHCELHRYHHRLEALSATEVAINPLPNVRALAPPEQIVRCVRAQLEKIPGTTLHGYSD